MPINRGFDSIGAFYRWGIYGHRYYYIPNNRYSRNLAKEKALRQGRAILANR
jgi:hypothetical protein